MLTVLNAGLHGAVSLCSGYRYGVKFRPNCPTVSGSAIETGCSSGRVIDKQRATDGYYRCRENTISGQLVGLPGSIGDIG